MFSIQLTSKNLELTQEIKNLTFEKLKKLEKWLANFPPDAISTTVLLKKRTHQTKDNRYTTKIALLTPWGMFHAHQEGFTLEESLVGAVDDIEDQLEEHKEKKGAD